MSTLISNYERKLFLQVVKKWIRQRYILLEICELYRLNKLRFCDTIIKVMLLYKEILKMNGMTAKEAAAKWGITSRQVQLLCSQGRILGAVRFGHAWLIPSDAQKPKDRRSFSGRCKNKDNSDGDVK